MVQKQAETRTGSVLEVEGLNYSFGKKQVLKDVGLSVGAGSFSVLLGPNGAGKTTLISLVTRLYESRTGNISIAGHDMRRHPTKALAQIGVVFQQPTLDLDLTVHQNLSYHAALHGMSGSQANARMKEELDRFDIAERLKEKVRNLNGGHRRRVEIARALMHNPRFLLCDEPTVGLDVPSRRAIVEHAHGLCKQTGIAVLWATHLIDEVSPDDHVIILHQGSVVGHGHVDEANKKAGGANIAETFNILTGGVKAEGGIA